MVLRGNGKREMNCRAMAVEAAKAILESSHHSNVVRLEPIWCLLRTASHRRSGQEIHVQTTMRFWYRLPEHAHNLIQAMVKPSSRAKGEKFLGSFFLSQFTPTDGVQSVESGKTV